LIARRRPRVPYSNAVVLHRGESSPARRRRPAREEPAWARELYDAPMRDRTEREELVGARLFDALRAASLGDGSNARPALVAYFWPASRELAYRLALCWNLAEGWPTEALEKGIVTWSSN